MLRIPSILITAGVLALAWAGPQGQGALANPDRSATVPGGPVLLDEDWSTLSAEWEAALAEWDADYEATRDIAERRKLRESHPAFAFWDRFDALSRTDGRAAVWMIEFAGRAGYRREQSYPVKAEAYARAFAAPGAFDASWMEGLLVGLSKDRRAVGDEAFASYLTRAAESSEVDAIRARALLVHGDWLAKFEDPEQRARGLGLLERAAALEDTPAAAEAAEILYVARNLTIGAVAPEIESSTADGDSFKLSDHRGKVVVLDFFGFW